MARILATRSQAIILIARPSESNMPPWSNKNVTIGYLQQPNRATWPDMKAILGQILQEIRTVNTASDWLITINNEYDTRYSVFTWFIFFPSLMFFFLYVLANDALSCLYSVSNYSSRKNFQSQFLANWSKYLNTCSLVQWNLNWYILLFDVNENIFNECALIVFVSIITGWWNNQNMYTNVVIYTVISRQL